MGEKHPLEKEPFETKTETGKTMGYEEYKEERRKVRDIADKMGIETDKDTEHYVVKIRDENGNVIRERHIMGREEIPLLGKGNKVIECIPAEFYISEIQSNPNISSNEILNNYRRQKEERRKAANE